MMATRSRSRADFWSGFFAGTVLAAILIAMIPLVGLGLGLAALLTSIAPPVIVFAAVIDAIVGRYKIEGRTRWAATEQVAGFFFPIALVGVPGLYFYLT
ncbi:hypothetical protein SAMN05444003_1412 [Cognatiyoonia sediminum]|uniref:Uncharacterized protein n=1 Tax=Cognatiyoonia sediminum TaxID=1508389 RepID=A0A1M5NGT4_9RHOB|nr:hypothetical protein [Cognatiyoonia sediminum]SHG88774.1 hypothetical protein SAMN05444003_1412 [Cognatiyoonia sediminum]